MEAKRKKKIENPVPPSTTHCPILTDNLSMSFLSTRSKYNCLISRSNLLGRPGYIVDPPDSTICLYRTERISIVAAWIVLNTSSAIPWPSTLIKCGWNRASGASNRSPPTLITRPSGSWNHLNEFYQKKKMFLRHTKRTINLPCTSPPRRLFLGPVSVPFQCHIRCNTNFPSSFEPFQSRQYDWMHNHVTTKALWEQTVNGY